MPPRIFTPRKANVPDNTNQSSTRNENPKYLAPHLPELAQELLIVSHVTELPLPLIITF
jgi:hypothetical protein